MAGNTQVAALATLTCKAGQRDAATAVLREFVDATAREDGTHVYLLHHGKDDATIVIYELYRDDDAAKDHSANIRKVRRLERAGAGHARVGTGHGRVSVRARGMGYGLNRRARPPYTPLRARARHS